MSPNTIARTKEIENSKRTLTANDRRALVLELRMRGWTIRQIANAVADKYGEEVLPKNYRTQLTIVQRDLESSIKEFKTLSMNRAQEVLELELFRLDEIGATFYPMAINGNIKAANLMLKIMERRSKYLGLDKPEKYEVRDWKYEVLNLYSEGKVTIEQIKQYLGDDLSREVIVMITTNEMMGMPKKIEMPEEIVDAEFSDKEPSDEMVATFELQAVNYPPAEEPVQIMGEDEDDE